MYVLYSTLVTLAYRDLPAKVLYCAGWLCNQVDVQCNGRPFLPRLTHSYQLSLVTMASLIFLLSLGTSCSGIHRPLLSLCSLNNGSHIPMDFFYRPSTTKQTLEANRTAASMNSARDVSW